MKKMIRFCCAVFALALVLSSCATMNELTSTKVIRGKTKNPAFLKKNEIMSVTVRGDKSEYYEISDWSKIRIFSDLLDMQEAHGEFSNEEKYQIMSYLFDDLPKRAETGLVRQVFVGKYFSSGGDTTPNLMINISLENPASTVEDKCEKVIFISTNTFKSPVDGTLNKTKAYTGLVRFSPYMAAVLNDNLLTNGEYFDLNLNKSFEEINKMEVVERISYSQHLMLDDNLENDIIAHEVCTKIIEAKNTAPDFIFMAMCIDFMYRISIGDLDAANEMWEKMLVYCTYCNIKPESLEETYGESLYFLKALKESEV